MIQITPQMRIVVAIEAQDFRKGIDGLARVCRDRKSYSGTVGNQVSIARLRGSFLAAVEAHGCIELHARGRRKSEL